jgi:cytoskeletal protein CcmA (bactofilin family)
MGGMAIHRKIALHRMQVMLVLVIVIVCAPLQAAGAQSSNPNGIIRAGETVQGSQFIFAPQINIEGTVDGDVFAFGQDVVVKGEIKGSLFTLSRTATIDGLLEGDLYTANPRLTLGPESSVGRSVYVLAGIVNLPPGSKIGRDLYLIGLSGEISSSVGRYQRVYLGIVQILEMLLDENGVLNPLLPPGFKLPWSFYNNMAARPAERAYHLYSAASGLGLSVAGLPMLLQPQLQTTSIDSAALGSWTIARLRTFAPLFLIGLLLLWLFPRFLLGSTGHLRHRPLYTLGVGVVVFFVGFGAAVLILALVLALGFFFAAINYWDLAFLIWGAGLGGLSLVLAIFSLAVGYLSRIIVAYLLGAILLNRLPTTVWGRRAWILLLGLVLVVLLLSIPILGWVLSMFVIMFGLGAIYLQLRQPREVQTEALTRLPEAKESEPQAQLSADEPADRGLASEPEASLEDQVETTLEETVNITAEVGSNTPVSADYPE